MKNKTVKMILAIAVLGLCCGAYVGVKSYVAHQEEREAKEDEEENSSEIVFEASADEIRSVSFMIDKKEVVFEKEDDVWTKQDEKLFPVDQTTLDDAVSSLTNIESDRVLENAEDLEQYGLDEPSNTIRIVTGSSEEEGADKTETEETEDKDTEKAESKKDGSEESRDTTLRIGDLNTASDQYYVSKDDDRNTVYLVDSSVVEPFTKELYDYAEGEAFPAVGDTSSINKITVTGEKEKSYTLKKEEDTGFWYIDGEKADSSKASSLAAPLGSFAYDTFVDYDCEDLSKYGLNKPYAVIEVDYQEEAPEDESADIQESENDDNVSLDDSNDSNESAKDTATTDSEDTEDQEEKEEHEPEMIDKHLKITVGAEAGDGNRYVCVNDSTEIYTVSGDSLSTYLDKTEADFWDMTVKYLTINNLDKLVVEYKNEKHTINVSRETSENEDGETEETTTYLLDGSETDKTAFETFYNKLNNITGERRLTEERENKSDPEMTVTYTTEDGDSMVEYYSYDTNYYAVTVENKTYLVNKMTVKSMLEAYEAVIGEIVE